MNNRDNLFTGVNPLLMSRLQAKNDFGGFHNQYLAELTKHLNGVLPDNYQARQEAKLTLTYHGYMTPQTRYPDILVTHGKTYTTLAPSVSETAPTLLLPIADDIIENSEFVIVIRSTEGE